MKTYSIAISSLTILVTLAILYLDASNNSFMAYVGAAYIIWDQASDIISYSSKDKIK